MPADTESFVVTIDGPAGAGKSSCALRAAEKLGFQLLDTGALYRAVAWQAKARDISWTDAKGLATIAGSMAVRFELMDERNMVWVGDTNVTNELRTDDISSGASQISAHPEVRLALLGLQRELGNRGQVVVEGRDTGTVVFPNAQVKVFLSATVDARVERRFKDLVKAGQASGPKDKQLLRVSICERDDRDRKRPVAPLAKPADATEIDSTEMTLNEVVDRIVGLVLEKRQ